MEDELIKYKLFVDKRTNGIVQPNGTFSGQNSNDFFINIPLYRSFNKYDEYVNIEKDKTTTIINRQQINPFFLELGFFETIKATNPTGQTMQNNYTEQETIYGKSSLYNIKINN